MERLTIPDERIDEHTTRRKFIDVEAVREHAMGFYWRLKAYEDTGLTPEEITAMRHTLEEYHRTADPLLSAKVQGRVVVLPCKVGQRVFALLGTDKHISECDVEQIGLGNEIGFVCIEPIGARGRKYGVSIKGFGKTVFLTREEAEKALEAME